MRVLFTGPDQALFHHLQEVVDHRTATIQVAENPVELEACLQQEIDIALIDLTRAQDHGLACMKRIAALAPWVRMLCLIPKDQIKLSIQAMRIGAFDEIHPPFSWESLLAKMEAACREGSRPLVKKGFWASLQDHFAAGSLAQIAGTELGRAWLEQDPGAQPDKAPRRPKNSSGDEK